MDFACLEVYTKNGTYFHYCKILIYLVHTYNFVNNLQFYHDFTFLVKNPIFGTYLQFLQIFPDMGRIYKFGTYLQLW